MTNEIMGRVLAGVERSAVEAMTANLSAIKENLRQAIVERANTTDTDLEATYG